MLLSRCGVLTSSAYSLKFCSAEAQELDRKGRRESFYVQSSLSCSSCSTGHPQPVGSHFKVLGNLSCRSCGGWEGLEWGFYTISKKSLSIQSLDKLYLILTCGIDLILLAIGIHLLTSLILYNLKNHLPFKPFLMCKSGYTYVGWKQNLNCSFYSRLTTRTQLPGPQTSCSGSWCSLRAHWVKWNSCLRTSHRGRMESLGLQTVTLSDGMTAYIQQAVKGNGSFGLWNVES